MGKVRFSILEKTPDRILREDMKFKGMTSRGAASYRTQAKALSWVNSSCNEESRSRLLVAGMYV